MERKIGEIFEYNGECYQCIPDTTDANCNNCFFQKSCIDITGDCSSTARSDGKSVAFKKLEKVGEPYHNSEKKLCQQYKCYINPLVTDEIVYVFADNKVVIEIKQTKEDMEEKKQKLDDLVGLYSSAKITYKEFDKELKALYTKQWEEDKPVLKPFNLEEAKEGKPVCTRDGRKARIICFDRNCQNAEGENYPIVALIANDNGTEEVVMYDDKGVSMYSLNHENDYDLMMLHEKKEGWVNVYKERCYESKEEAIRHIAPGTHYIDTIRVEWEDKE